MKKVLVRGLVLGMVMMMGANIPVFASNLVTPVLVQGNDSNHETHIHSMENEKVDSPQNGSYFLANNRIEVIVNNETKSIDVKVLDETVNIEYVHMKGGNSFNCYNYEGDLLKGISQDENLICPTNNGGNQAAISHFTVYWQEVETVVTPPVEEELPNVGDGTEDDQIMVNPPVGEGEDNIEVAPPVEEGEDNFLTPNLPVGEDNFLTPNLPVGEGEDNIEVMPPVGEGEDNIEVDQPATEGGDLPEIGIDTPATENGDLPEIGVDVELPNVGDGTEEDKIEVPTIEENVNNEEVPTIEENVNTEVPNVEETVNNQEVPMLPYTGGTDSLMVLFGSLAMVGTGLGMFKRK